MKYCNKVVALNLPPFSIVLPPSGRNASPSAVFDSCGKPKSCNGVPNKAHLKTVIFFSKLLSLKLKWHYWLFIVNVESFGSPYKTDLDGNIIKVLSAGDCWINLVQQWLSYAASLSILSIANTGKIIQTLVETLGVTCNKKFEPSRTGCVITGVSSKLGEVITRSKLATSCFRL